MMRSTMNWSYADWSMQSARSHFQSISETSQMQGGGKQYNNPIGKLDFEHFIKFLEQIAEKIFPSIPLSRAFTYLIGDFIVPILWDKRLPENRCVQNNKILELVTKLENEDMVQFLTVLHKAIIKYFEVYADQRMTLDFDNYLWFCTDFCIFPDLITKPLLYRIFHTLSNINDMQLPDSTQMSGMTSLMGG